MTVRELQEKLSKCDPGTDVVCYCEDEKLAQGRGTIILDIIDVNTTQAEMARINGIPALKIGSGQNAAPIVILEITSDL